MATYRYDITTSEVISQYLRFANEVDTSVLDPLIDKAAGKVNEVLIAHGITPTDIVDVVGTENDYENLRQLVMLGAAVYSLRSDTGAVGETNVRAMTDEFNQTLNNYLVNPTLLQSFSQLTDAQRSARSTATAGRYRHASQRALARMVDQSDPRRRRL